MTEDEAKKRMCPFLMMGITITAGCSVKNLDSVKEMMVNQMLCTTRYCMMWRWYVTPILRPSQVANVSPESAIKPSGYCGLGGKQ
jgi:hypothetical protein